MARVRRDSRSRDRDSRSRGGFEDFIRDLLSFYDRISGAEYIPESSEIKEQMDDIAERHGVELYREGTNRSIYKNGDYVYKCAHKLDAAADNIAEYEITNYILDNNFGDLQDHFALSERYMGGSEYILEQEFITPLHEAARGDGGEAENALRLLMESPDAYESLMSYLTDYFLISDVSPRSIFNFGLKTDYNGRDVLAILDYGYFIPKGPGELLCPECGDGVLKYDIKDIRAGNKSEEEEVINKIKSSVMEKYVCTNTSCKLHNRPPLAGRVIEMYNEGLINLVDERNRRMDGDRYADDRRSRSSRDSRERRPRSSSRRDSRGGFNR